MRTMFSTYEEFKAVIKRARGEFAERFRARLKEVCACDDVDVTIRFLCPHPHGIEFTVAAGVPGNSTDYRFCLPYDESCWDLELLKAEFIVRWVLEEYGPIKV